jgi:hypothetical protein
LPAPTNGAAAPQAQMGGATVDIPQAPPNKPNYAGPDSELDDTIPF